MRGFGKRFAVEFGIVVFENVGERVAVRVQFFQKRIVNGLVAALEKSALRRAALFRQSFGVFFQRAGRNGFAGKQPVDFREFFLVRVLAVMEFFQVALERGFQVRLEPAIHNLELLEIEQRGNGRLAVPPVADGLKIIVRRGNVAERLFGFDIEFYVSEIRREIKGIIGAALRDAVFLAFDFDFLLVRIFLRVVVHVPAERDAEICQ